jgi:hypothetical protein
MNRKKIQQRNCPAVKQITSNPLSIKQVIPLIGVLLICFCLNVIGLDWGCSGYVSWQPDSIEGVVILSQMPNTFATWTHKYPRGQYLVNEIVYYPLVQHWKRHPVTVQTPDGKMAMAVITGPRLKMLALITRWITLLMSVGTVLAVYLTASTLFNDRLTAFLAGLAFSVSHLFCFFASTGNVDVPSVFWFCWAGWAALRAVQTIQLRYFLLLGFCAAYSVGTKEGQGTYLAGLGVGMLALHIQQSRKQGKSIRMSVLSFFSFKFLAAAAMALMVFIFLNGFFWNGADEFMARVGQWRGVIEKEFLQPPFGGQWNLLKLSCRWLYWSVGWPMLAAAVVSLLYLLWREPVKLLFLLAPLIAFYLLTVMKIHFVAERFLLGGLAGLAIAAGKMFSDGIRRRSKLRYVVMVLTLGVYLLSAMYCLGLRLELRSDTRKRAEQWFYANVSRDKSIGAVMPRNYAPRMQYEGYTQYNDWVSMGVKTMRGTEQIMPDYLILSTSWPCMGRPEDANFRGQVSAGKTNYEQITSFNPFYLKPARCILGLAGWPYNKHDFLSPSLYIYQKKTPGPN